MFYHVLHVPGFCLSAVIKRWLVALCCIHVPRRRKERGEEGGAEGQAEECTLWLGEPLKKPPFLGTLSDEFLLVNHLWLKGGLVTMAFPQVHGCSW